MIPASVGDNTRVIRLTEADTITASVFEIYSKANENQLYHWREPQKGIYIAESPLVILRALEAGHVPLSFLTEERYVSEALSLLQGVPRPVDIYVAELSMLSKITGYPLCRGMLAAMERPDPLPTIALLKDLPSRSRIAVLEDVVNPTNIGAIFRSAAALNMDAVLLTPACCDPLTRRSARVSMGTVFQIPWTYLEVDTQQPSYAPYLHQAGYKIVSMALSDDSILLDDPVLAKEQRLAIVMGTEGDGLRCSSIEAGDYTVRIPMSHGVDSLNVAAAAAVAFYELGKSPKP